MTDLPARAILLFQGDSITDCGRDRGSLQPNDPAGLGPGYVGLLAAQLLAERPEAGWRFLNRGVSGDRSVDVLARWEADALALRPDLVSLLVGANDTWHQHLFGRGISVEEYAACYRRILESTRARLPHCRLVLGQSFALPGGVFKDEWMDELRARGEVVRDLAREFDAVFVPYQEMFQAELSRHSPAELADDGVHPTARGHELMARAWRQAAGL